MGLLDDYEEIASAERLRAEKERELEERRKPQSPEWAAELLDLLRRHSVPSVAIYEEVRVLEPIPPRLFRSRWLRPTEYRLIRSEAWSIRGFVGHVTGDADNLREVTTITLDGTGKFWEESGAILPGRVRLPGDYDITESIGVPIAPAVKVFSDKQRNPFWEARLAAVAARQIVDGTYKVGTEQRRGGNLGIILVGAPQDHR